jgi:hypothetical protein
LLVLVLLVLALAGIVVVKSESYHHITKKTQDHSMSALFAGETVGQTQALKRGRLGKAKRDKRVWLRREGNPVEVLIADGSAATGPISGSVLNRSRGGLLISAPQPATVGSFLHVRAVHAPENSGWVAIEIRHCGQRNDRWLLGCKFRQPLPWSVLLLFG